VICIDEVVSYRGAKARVLVETSDNSTCKEVLEVWRRRDISRALEVVRSHGGCRLVSENPLQVVSRDGKVRVTLEPMNFLARAFWGTLVERVREYCE
jgi:hypothetical protein